MCVGEATRVVSVESDEAALVDLRGSLRRVPLILIASTGEKVVPGDWLLVQTGLAVARMSADEAAEHRARQQRGVDYA
jgi:hydrogenase assembly chaperone HypC/HupF